jgi:hypothetical protein
MKLFVKIPELTLLTLLSLGVYLFIFMATPMGHAGVLSSNQLASLMLSSFLLSLAIAIIAVVAGIGGGVIFTPLLLAFTAIDTLVVRATGLIVAMFSGLISTGPLLRHGLADIRLILFGAIPITSGAVAGAYSALALDQSMGARSDAWVRLLLGLILLLVALLLVRKGADSEYPQPLTLDPLSRRLDLHGSYEEPSLAKTIHYRAGRTLPGGLLLLGVGFLGGFFGLGGGWAVVPVLNLVMAVPLKAAAASSGALLALGNGAAIWPYIFYGALIPALTAPWLLGQVIGGIMGAHLLTRVKASLVRNTLVAMLVLTALKLVMRGLQGL